MTANDPDYSYLIGSGNDFYMFKELQEYHNCYGMYMFQYTVSTCLIGYMYVCMYGVLLYF